MQCKSLKLDESKIKEMFRGLDAEDLGEFEFGNFIDAAVHDYIVSSDARLHAAAPQSRSRKALAAVHQNHHQYQRCSSA